MKDTRHASDALANERTFLAYLRTALAFIAFGFVIARFSLFEREISTVAHIAIPARGISVVFGTAMAAAGIVVGVYGAYRYVSTEEGLRRDETRAMPPSAALIGGLAVAAIGAVVAISFFAVR